MYLHILYWEYPTSKSYLHHCVLAGGKPTNSPIPMDVDMEVAQHAQHSAVDVTVLGSAREQGMNRAPAGRRQ